MRVVELAVRGLGRRRRKVECSWGGRAGGPGANEFRTAKSNVRDLQMSAPVSCCCSFVAGC